MLFMYLIFRYHLCTISLSPENIRKPYVFWCFQGVQKGFIRSECVKEAATKAVHDKYVLVTIMLDDTHFTDFDAFFTFLALIIFIVICCLCLFLVWVLVVDTSCHKTCHSKHFGNIFLDVRISWGCHSCCH